MKKIILLIITPLIFSTALSAQSISQAKADSIVVERMSQETRTYTIYAKETVQTEMTITTTAGEKFVCAYPCWVYYVNYTGSSSRYLIVKESNGNVLEVNPKSSNAVPDGLAEWRIVSNNLELCHCIMDTLKGEWSWFMKYSMIGIRDNEFTSIVKILSQNEDTSINYEVFVADTLFYQGSFQFLRPESVFDVICIEVDIKVPHKNRRKDGKWYLCLQDFAGKPSEETLLLWDGMFEQNLYFYQKMREE